MNITIIYIRIKVIFIGVLIGRQARNGSFLENDIMNGELGGGGVLSDLAHIGIYTLDLDRSIEFYVRCLGFRLEWKGIVHHRTGELPVATLRMGACVIELVLPADAGRVRRMEGPIQHLALRVEDLDGCIAHLGANGIDLDEAVEEIEYGGGMRHCFVRGPSNERIELCQGKATSHSAIFKEES